MSVVDRPIALVAAIAAAALVALVFLVTSAPSVQAAVDCDKFTGPKQELCKKREDAKKPDNGNDDDSALNCPKGSREGTVGGKAKCLKPGQKCKKKYKTDYAKVGLKCKGKKNKRTGKKVYKLKDSGG